MHERLPGSNADVLGYRLSGSLSLDEIRTLHREIDAAIREHGGIRLLLDIENMSLPEPRAILEDLKMTPEFIGKVERYAVVGDSRWHDMLTSLTGALSMGEARYFERDRMAEAWNWLRE